MNTYYKDNLVELIHGDCLEVMEELIKQEIKVDMIFADLPFDTTQNHWDSIIPLEKLWEYYRNLIKPNGAIVLHGYMA